MKGAVEREPYAYHEAAARDDDDGRAHPRPVREDVSENDKEKFELK